MDELRRIIEDSEIMAEDDALWPQPDRVGRQVCLSRNRNKILIPKGHNMARRITVGGIE